MIHSSLSYEELDPDNQDRPSDYYLGVADATRYFIDMISEIRNATNLRERLEEIEELGMRLYITCEDRRRLFFWHHMNAGQLKRPEIRRPERAVMEVEHGTPND